jgi:fatty-acyl-CoA synthase
MDVNPLRGLRRLIRAGGFLRLRPQNTYTVADRFEDRVDDRLENVFLRYEDESLTWIEVEAAANRVANWARGQGIGRGDVVALLMENRPEYIISWLGLAKLGAVTALINTNLSGRALDHALRTAAARHLIVGSELLDALDSASGEVTGELGLWVAPDPDAPEFSLPDGAKNLTAVLEEASHERPASSVRQGLVAGDPLFYIYTSGTTGNPKAALLSHLRFFQAGDSFAWAVDFNDDDVEYLALPLYHSAGGVVAVGRAMNGGGVLAIRRRFSASKFWDDVRRYDATCFQYIGEFCRYLLAQPSGPGDKDHRIRVVAGNGLRPDIWEEFQQRFGIPKIIEFYGATEGNTVMVNLGGKVGAVGYYPRILDRVNNAKIIRYDVETDAHPRSARGFCVECGPDEAGEMLGKIPADKNAMAGRFEGYTSKEANEKKILRDVFEKGDAWFRSGDLLYRDRAGYYYFVDRIGDTFRWKGENVSTQEVAELASGFPGLDMINVYGVQVPDTDGRAGMLAYVSPDESVFDGEAFYAFTTENLPAYAAPVFVRQLTDVEVTGTFKLRKVELKEQGFDAPDIKDPVFVRDDQTRSYRPLTPEILAEIRDGRRRL